MALIDVVKYNGNDEEFIWKYPSEDLRLGTQLIVNNAQAAIFVKNGKIYDQFNPGRYTLTTANIPLLNKLINLPFGDKSPFTAEVWYVNLISKLDNKWGTKTPIQIEDPEYGVVVPVRAYGQFGIKIGEPKKFFETIVGTAEVYTANKIVEYFTGKILASTQSIILKKVLKEKVSILTIAMNLDELSKSCSEALRNEFANFGISIVNFFVISINIPEDDPSVVKLKEAKELAMKIKTVGKDIYQMERSFDVMGKAAENPGTGGDLIGAGIGMGMGLGMGAGMGSQMGNVMGNMNVNPQNQQATKNCPKCKNVIQVNAKYCNSCGTEQSGIKEDVKELICDKCSKTSTVGSKHCIHCGDEFILCKNCGIDNPESTKFCINCGKPMDNKCPKCNTELTQNTKFCGKCGHKLTE